MGLYLQPPVQVPYDKFETATPSFSPKEYKMEKGLTFGDDEIE